MASADIAKPVRADWALANPWSWALGGLAACLVSVVWAQAAFEVLPGLRAFVIFLGLLAVAGGVALRLNSSADPYLRRFPQGTRTLVLAKLAGLFGLIALGTTFFLVSGLLGIDSLDTWKPNARVILWVIAAPMSAAAMVLCLNRLQPRAEITERDEAAALLATAAVAVFAAAWGLYNPERPRDWDTLRMALSMLFLVALVAAPLAFASTSIRRAVVSFLLLFHFFGIVTATMSVPPTPWIMTHLWVRVYRPYLEFMYLNNAYHFYAPEPGPASYLWFRITGVDDKGEARAYWEKVPRVDDNGQHGHAVSLEYQRILAITENTVPSDPAPAAQNPDGTPSPYIERRMRHAPGPFIIGKPQVKNRIPFHPFVPQPQQYIHPIAPTRMVLESYARHVCREAKKANPDWQKITSVKIYRVVHMIPPITDIARRSDYIEPNDPVFYRPFFLGEYDPTGRLVDPEDPFLYWMLPILREDGNRVQSRIFNYACKHAGDPAWIYIYDARTRHFKLIEGDEP